MISEDRMNLALKRMAQWCFILTAGISSLSLVGWFSGVLILASVRPAYIPLAPSTAVCFILLSVTSFLYVRNPGHAAGRMLAGAGACLIVLICASTLTAFFLGATISFEHAGLRIRPPDAGIPIGYMSPITAALFLISAGAMLLLLLSPEARPRFRQAAAFLAMAASLAGFIVILGYAHGTPLLYGGTIIPVALPTALAFVLCGLGLLAAAGPDVQPISVFAGRTVRSLLMRAFLPVVVVLVVLDSFIYKAAFTRAGNPALVAALIAVVSALAAGLIISKLAKTIGGEIDRVHAVRRQAEEGARFLASIIQNLPDAVCVIDAQGAVISWNKGAEKILGYRAEEIIGKTVSAIIPGELTRAVLEHDLSVLNAGGSFSGRESVRLTKDGRRVPVELTGVVIRDHEQAMHHYAFIMVDITDRKKAEEERLKGHMLESIGILAGGIAHDFNNLLSAILGNIHIAKMSVHPGDKVFNRLADAEQICDMAAELSKRLLTFATGGDPVKRTASLTDLLADTVAAMLKDTAIRAEIALPDDLYTVAVDLGQMKQVISNLLVNAKEAMPEGGALSVRGENIRISAQDNVPMREGSYLKISIKDTGPGVPAENLARIFDPYYSTKDTYSKKGLGLGLAVCYSVMKRHDGLITAESEVGKGTTFFLYLPAAGRA